MFRRNQFAILQVAFITREFTVRSLVLLLILGLALASCTTSAPTPSPASHKLTITGWFGGMPAALLEAFQTETGIAVEYVGYDYTEQALEQLRQGAEYDLMVVGSHHIPLLVAESTIVPLNYANIPNARNIGLNFRDLSFDPGNRYSVIYQWGTTGLLVRTDLINRPITRWTDLWDPVLDGKILLWHIPRDIVSVLLKSLGYSINTTDPVLLEKARQQAPALAQRVGLAHAGDETAVSYLASGEYVVALSWSYDAILAREQPVPISYVIPVDGTILWFDCLVIPASSSRKVLAERFIDFLLRPDISALATNLTGYPTANDAALDLIDPVLRADAKVFPSPEILMNAEVEAALDPTTLAIHEQIWQTFVRSRP